MSLRLEVATELPAEITSQQLELALHAAQKATEVIEDGQISLAFVDEPTAQALNNQFAGNDYATDVLSFPYYDDESGVPTSEDVIGEIVICLPVAVRQAAEHGSTLLSELTLLFVHGTLHLLGYDHGGEDEASFRALQDGIMDKLKVKSRNIFDGNVH